MISNLLNNVTAKDEENVNLKEEAEQLLRKKHEIMRIVTARDPQLADEINEILNHDRKVLAIYSDSENRKQTEEKNQGAELQTEAKNLFKHAMLEKGINQKADPKLFSVYQKEIYSYYQGEHEMDFPSNINDTDWQYVLVFPNPDFDPKSNKSIPEDAALRMLDSCFLPDVRKKNAHDTKIRESKVCEAIFNSSVDKMVSKNGHSTLRWCNGGGMVKDPSCGSQSGWKFKSAHPRDMLTLIRNVTLYKLSKVLQIRTHSVLSVKGDLIYVLLDVSDDALKVEADWNAYPMQYDVSSTDLISLMPCDSFLRPYGVLNKHKPARIKQLEDELLSFHENLSDFDTANNQQVEEEMPLPEREWNAYEEFLLYIKSKKDSVVSSISRNAELKGLLVEELYQGAFEHVAQKTGIRLKNIWNYFGTQPLGAFKDYCKRIEGGVDIADPLWKRFLHKNSVPDISIFKSSDRIKLIVSLIFRQLRLDRMVEHGALVKFFPLHSEDYVEEIKRITSKIRYIAPPKSDLERKPSSRMITSKLIDYDYTYVRENWKFSFFASAPGGIIRNYFGEKIAFYYEFLSLYTKYLFFLGLIGIAVYIVQVNDTLQSRTIEYFSELGFKKSTVTIAFNTMYSFVVIIWGTIFLEHWKRREIFLATLWGQTDTVKQDVMLPSFTGRKRRSPVTDNMNETFYPLIIHLFKKMIASIVALIIVLIVILIVVYLLYFRNWLVVNKIGGAGNKFIVNVPTILNVLQITLFNIIYTKVAYAMNNFENHKTYFSYENSLASKIFIFQFVNSFNSLVIISFIKKSIDFMGGCVKTMQFGKIVSAYNYCDEELENQMITISLMNFIKNFIEVGLPWLMNKLRGKLGDVSGKLKEVELQNKLNEFDKGYVDGTFDDYLELIIQFGYVTLFAISFSLLPIIAFFTNIIEVQVDKTKLLYLMKRPHPVAVSSIGNWYAILDVLSYIAVFFNCGILIFTSNNYHEFTMIDKWIYFMFMCFFYLISKLIFVRLIPDVPTKVMEIQKRHANVLNKTMGEVDSKRIVDGKITLNMGVTVF